MLSILVSAKSRSLDMHSKLFVANLGRDVTESALTELFAAHGEVEFVKLVMDRATGNSKGYGFVKMRTDQEAQAAMAALNGRHMGARRPLEVSEAKPPSEGGRGQRGGRR